MSPRKKEMVNILQFRGERDYGMKAERYLIGVGGGGLKD